MSGRMQKSAKNMVSGVMYRMLTTVTAFIVRTVFLKCLSNDYLGVNGLYSSILSMLSLAELGFSTAMVYSMYKPLAVKDYLKLSQLMQLYRKVYRIIGTVILLVGLALVPFLDYFIKNKPDISGLTFYYLLFLCDSVFSYWFYAYINSVFQADQRASVISNNNSIFNLIKSGLQIILLVLFHNFTVYLLTQIGCTIAQNLFLAYKAKKDYPIFNFKEKSELPQTEKKRIFEDVKALMLQKISFKVLNTSDSLIISAFVGINWVGLLSNYLLITEAVVAVLSQIFSAISASLGNYFAKEDKESGYSLFLKVDFLNFWLYGFSTTALFILLSPFIKLWIGTDYMLGSIVVMALVSRFFIEGYMNMMSTFRSTLGLFVQGKYFPLLVAGINIVLSIGLSYPLGIAGVLLATPLSRCCINVWYMPLVIHRDGFTKSPRSYYVKFISRVSALIVLNTGMYYLSQFIFSKGITILSFIIMVVLVSIIPNMVFLVLFCRTAEFKYYSKLLSNKLYKK